jgi:hypothetical protein
LQVEMILDRILRQRPTGRPHRRKSP